MAPSIQHVAPGRLRIGEGGGCMGLFGLPFFGAGVSMILASLGFLPLNNEGAVPALVWLVLGLMGLVFALVGGTLAFGRSWSTVDATERQVIKEWGLLWPMRARIHPLGGYTTVVLGFDEGDSDTANQFPVSLKSDSGLNLRLCSVTQYADALASATAVARHLRLDIEDASTDHPTRLSADQAGRPLRDRLQAERRQNERVERPPAARSEVREEGGDVRIVIPMPRAHPVALAALLIPAAIPFVLFAPLLDFFRQTQTPDPVGWIFLGFLVLGFGVLPASVALNGFLRSRLGYTAVRVSGEGIGIQERGAWRTRTIASIPASDILGVDYSTRQSVVDSETRAVERHTPASGHAQGGSPMGGQRTERVLAALSRLAKGRGVTIKSRQGLTRFGEGLADEEIRYLHSAVRRGLATARPEARDKGPGD